MVYVVDDVSSERLIEHFRVESDGLLLKLTADKGKDGHLQGVRSVDDKRTLECALVHQRVHLVFLGSELVHSLALRCDLELGSESEESVVEEGRSESGGPGKSKHI